MDTDTRSYVPWRQFFPDLFGLAFILIAILISYPFLKLYVLIADFFDRFRTTATLQK